MHLLEGKNLWLTPRTPKIKGFLGRLNRAADALDLSKPFGAWASIVRRQREAYRL
jgi:hypothetical protein